MSAQANEKEDIALPLDAHERFFDDYLVRAEELLHDAESHLENRRYPAVVSAAQQAFELAVKGLFHLVEMPPPRSHRICSPATAERLRRLSEELRDVVGPVGWRALALPRILFLADFWAAAYTQAKYGEDTAGATAPELFGRREASLALAHLKELIARLERVRQAVLVLVARQLAAEDRDRDAD